MTVKNLPDDFKGMWIDWRYNKKGERIARSQYWVYGKGYYRKWQGTVVFHHGKRFGEFKVVKKRLKKIINGGGKYEGSI